MSHRGRRGGPVKKPFPWGFAAGCAVLVVALGSIIGYAVANQGTGDTSSLGYVEKHIPGLQIRHDQARNHVQGTVPFPGRATSPPDGGNHNPVPQSCAVYSASIPTENAVHSMEHGAVWVTYNPAVASPSDVAALRRKVDGNPYRLLSPYPGQAAKISLQAWGEQLTVDSVSDPRVDTFLKSFTNGPQSPELGASCVGNTTTAPAVGK